MWRTRYLRHHCFRHLHRNFVGSKNQKWSVSLDISQQLNQNFFKTTCFVSSIEVYIDGTLHEKKTPGFPIFFCLHWITNSPNMLLEGSSRRSNSHFPEISAIISSVEVSTDKFLPNDLMRTVLKKNQILSILRLNLDFSTTLKSFVEMKTFRFFNSYFPHIYRFNFFHKF